MVDVMRHMFCPYSETELREAVRLMWKSNIICRTNEEVDALIEFYNSLGIGTLTRRNSEHMKERLEDFGGEVYIQLDEGGRYRLGIVPNNGISFPLEGWKKYLEDIYF